MDYFEKFSQLSHFEKKNFLQSKKEVLSSEKLTDSSWIKGHPFEL